MADWTPGGFVGEQNQIIARYAPPPPPGMESPMLWGDEAVVRERFGQGAGLSITKRMLTFDVPSKPRETEAYFRQYIGPMQVLVNQLDETQISALVEEMAAH